MKIRADVDVDNNYSTFAHQEDLVPFCVVLMETVTGKHREDSELAAEKFPAIFPPSRPKTNAQTRPAQTEKAS